MAATFWTALAAVSALVTTIIACIDHIKTNKLHKKELTIKALSELENTAINYLYHYTPKALEKISCYPQSEEYKAITHWMDLMQMFAIGLDEGVYDEDVIWHIEISKLVRVYINIESMIAKKRSISGLNDYAALERFGNKIKAKYPHIK